jgi:hypothetical protein
MHEGIVIPLTGVSPIPMLITSCLPLKASRVLKFSRIIVHNKQFLPFVGRIIIIMGTIQHCSRRKKYSNFSADGLDPWMQLLVRDLSDACL